MWARPWSGASTGNNQGESCIPPRQHPAGDHLVGLVANVSPLIPSCPRLQALGQGEERHQGRAGPSGILPSLFHFPRAEGERYAQNQAEGTDGSSSAFSRMAVWHIPAFYILIMCSACPGGSSEQQPCLPPPQAVLESSVPSPGPGG